ncbi:MAG: stage II sporulation protein M [Candidatus Pristimantibacillus sp.]
MFNRREIMAHFKLMNPYIAFGFILFFAGVVMGGIPTAFSNYLEEQIQSLSGLANTLNESANPTLAFIIFIFINNAVKAIFIIYLGSLLGILPAIFLVFNGMVIGFLMQHVANTQGIGEMFTLIIGLIPHGIIEIPAIVIACAYGMKFGKLIINKMGSILFPVKKKETEAGRGEIESFVIRTVPVVVILTVALLIASIIESTISIWLMTLMK